MSQDAGAGPAHGLSDLQRIHGGVDLAGSPARALSVWLEKHPDAEVGAVNTSGAPTEMPGTIALGPHQIADCRSMMELVVAEDLMKVTEAFVAALSTGLGAATVRLAADPHRPLHLHYVDVRGEHGVILRLVTGSDDTALPEGHEVVVAPTTPVRPRLGAMTKNEVGTITSVDPSITLMLGWSKTELVGHSTLEFIHPDDHVRAIDNWVSRFGDNDSAAPRTVRLRYKAKDGSWLWLETANEFTARPDGTTTVACQVIDVSVEMAATEALRQNEQFLRRLTDTVPVGIFHVSIGGDVAFVNPLLRSLIGDASILTQADLARAMLGDDAALLEEAVKAVLSSGSDTDLEVSIASNEGRPSWSSRIALRAVTDGDQVIGVFGCTVDVTELKTLANTDPLTGILNRRAILDRLGADSRAADGVGVIFADLDGFKVINDTAGHRTGDRLLAEVAARLRSGIRPTDRIGRLGGDEFLIVCPGIASDSALQAVTDRLHETLHSPFRIEDQTFSIRASFGASRGDRSVSPEQLVADADAAMYRAKQSGRHLLDDF